MTHKTIANSGATLTHRPLAGRAAPPTLRSTICRVASYLPSHDLEVKFALAVSGPAESQNAVPAN